VLVLYTLKMEAVSSFRKAVNICRLHGVIHQKTVVFIVTIMRSSVLENNVVAVDLKVCPFSSGFPCHVLVCNNGEKKALVGSAPASNLKMRLYLSC
jgi:hypothetical protein